MSSGTKATWRLQTTLAESASRFFVRPCLPQVMFNEYKGNMEVVNDELDAIRAKMLDESQQMKDGAQQMGR